MSHTFATPPRSIRNHLGFYLIGLFLSFIFWVVAGTTFGYSQCDECTGKDEWKALRTVIEGDAGKERPFDSVVKINVKRFYNPNWGGGTASFIAKDKLVTARHTLVRKGAIRKINFNTVKGKVFLKKKDFTVHYYEGPGKLASDVAVIHITNSAKLPEGVTQFKIIEDFDSADLENRKIHLTGYPCDSQGQLIEKQADFADCSFDRQKIFIGYPMFTCQGDSGAPLWVEIENVFYVVGIHHGGPEGVKPLREKQHNMSVLINEQVIEWLQSLPE